MDAEEIQAAMTSPAFDIDSYWEDIRPRKPVKLVPPIHEPEPLFSLKQDPALTDIFGELYRAQAYTDSLRDGPSLGMVPREPEPYRGYQRLAEMAQRHRDIAGNRIGFVVQHQAVALRSVPVLVTGQFEMRSESWVWTASWYPFDGTAVTTVREQVDRRMMMDYHSAEVMIRTLEQLLRTLFRTIEDQSMDQIVRELRT